MSQIQSSSGLIVKDLRRWLEEEAVSKSDNSQKGRDLEMIESRSSVQLATFDQYRSQLFSLAYRMLGSVAEAEDMLQETFIRWQTEEGRSGLSARIPRHGHQPGVHQPLAIGPSATRRIHWPVAFLSP
jgi:hypothetical protein